MSLRYGLPMPYLSIIHIIDSSKKMHSPFETIHYTADKKFFSPRILYNNKNLLRLIHYG